MNKHIAASTRNPIGHPQPTKYPTSLYDTMFRVAEALSHSCTDWHQVQIAPWTPYSGSELRPRDTPCHSIGFATTMQCPPACRVALFSGAASPSHSVVQQVRSAGLSFRSGIATPESPLIRWESQACCLKLGLLLLSGAAFVSRARAGR